MDDMQVDIEPENYSVQAQPEVSTFSCPVHTAHYLFQGLSPMRRSPDNIDDMYADIPGQWLHQSTAE